jgi:hypothetical protein
LAILWQFAELPDFPHAHVSVTNNIRGRPANSHRWNPIKRKQTVKSAGQFSGYSSRGTRGVCRTQPVRGVFGKGQASIQEPYTNHIDTIYKPYPQELLVLDQYYTNTIAIACPSKGTHHTHIERTCQNMAKVTVNQLLELLQGGIGVLVFRQMPDGTIILS